MKKFDRVLANRYRTDDPVNLKNKRNYSSSSIRFRWNDTYIVKNRDYSGWYLLMDDIIRPYTSKSFRNYILDFVEHYNKFANLLGLPYQSILNLLRVEVIYTGKLFTDFREPSMIKVRWGRDFYHIIHFNNNYSNYEQYKGEERNRIGEVCIHHPIENTVQAFVSMLKKNNELIPTQYCIDNTAHNIDYSSLVTLVDMIDY